MSFAFDEDWKAHYDALMNLRVLNKFHYSELLKLIDSDCGRWAG
jgi:hypothetical protein